MLLAFGATAGSWLLNQFGGLADGLALPHGLAGHVASELGRAG